MGSKRDREKKEARRTNAREWAAKQEQSFGATATKTPEGVEFLNLQKVETGRLKVDFMPFKASKGNPGADEGFEHFERTYFVHRIPGADGKSSPYCCLAQFSKKCPVCTFLNRPGTDKKLIQDMKSKKRHLWLVNDRPGEKKVKFKVLDTGDWNRGMGFGELMRDAIANTEGGGGFANLDGGMTASLVVKELAMEKNKYNGVTRIDFAKRDYDYPENLLDEAPCLDDMLIEPTEKSLTRLLEMGEPDEDEGPEDEDDRKVSMAAVPDDDDEDEDEDEEEDVPAKASGKKASKSPVEDDEEDEDDEDSDDDSDLEDEDDEDEPAVKKKKKVAVAAKDDDEDEDDDD